MTAPAVSETDTAPAGDGEYSLAEALNRRAESLGFLPDDPGPDAPSEPAPKDAPPADQPTEVATPGVDSTKPADELEPPADQPDPFKAALKDAAPLPYRVNGADKQFDGILLLKDGRALVPADRVDDVRNRIAREESNAAAVKGLIAEKQAVEQRFGGVKGITEKLELAAQTDAAALLILNAIASDPTRFVAVENGQIVPNTAQITMLRREAALAAKDAQWRVREEWGEAEQTLAQSSSDAQVRESAVPNALTQYFNDIHADDRAMLTRNASAYLFTVTPEQARDHGWPVGALMVDLPRMQADVQHLKSVRGVTATAVAKREVAERVNAARTPAKPVVPPKPKPAPRNGDGTFKERPKLTPGQVFDRIRSGGSIANHVPDDDA